MTGLVGWWPLHENSGSTVRDLSGNGNHGTLNGGGVTQGVAGRGGLEAVELDGDSSYISIGNQSSLNFSPSGSFSWNIWLKPQDYTNVGDGYIWIQHERSYFIQRDSNSMELTCNIGAASASFEVTPTVNEWAMATLTYDNGTLTLYYNGEQKNQVSVSSEDMSSDDVLFGALDGTYTWHADGSIGPVRAYSRALTPQEIQTLYEWGSGDYTDRSYHDGTDSGAVSRWKFDGDVTDSWSSNDGSDNTSAGFVSDAIRGQAKRFDGDDDYISIGSTPTLSGYTLSVWMKLNSPNDGDSDAIFHMRENNDLFLEERSGSIVFQQFNSNANSKSVSEPVSANVWNHWTGTWNGDKIILYKNGVPVGAASISSMQSADSAIHDIGRYRDGNGRYFDGSIDDLRLYNRALSPSEVFQLYQRGTRGRDMRKLTVGQR